MTSEQRAYLKEHINDRPRKALAEKLNISYANLLKWVHKLGGDIDYDSFKTNFAFRDKVKELYETMSISEIAEHLNCKYDSVASAVQRMHLHRTNEETRRRLRKKSNSNWKAFKGDDKVERRVSKMKRQIKVDMMLVRSGEKPLTNRYYRMYPEKTQRALNHLCCKRNYFMYPNKKDRVEPIAFYDSETNRLSPKQEQYYIDKYSIKFIEADE